MPGPRLTASLMAPDEYSGCRGTVSDRYGFAILFADSEAWVIGLGLVRPLEDDWRDILDRIAQRHRWPTSRDVKKLADCVAELSRTYNDSERARSPLSESGAARLGFSFVRDVPKGAAAVRELVSTGAITAASVPSHDADARHAADGVDRGALPAGSRAVRVLDVGAGLGAMTWGVVRALRAAGAAHAVDATWVDDDAGAMNIGAEIVRERAADVRVRSVARRLDHTDDLGRFDLVVVGNVLSELDVPLSDGARTARHVEIVRRLLERHVEAHGSLVVVEPALRDRTRRLHRVRDALAELGFSIFAPCLHRAPCPALERESDWCHEDLPIDLPEWLVPVARAAGLRYQRLTFSYLVLRRDAARLRDAIGSRPGTTKLRVVSERRTTKGKCEAFLCGDFRSAVGSPTVARACVARLDRDRTDANETWNELRRGEVLEVDPSPEVGRPRIGRDTAVNRIEKGGGTPAVWNRIDAGDCRRLTPGH